MDSWGLSVAKNAYFSLLTRTNHFLLVIFCDPTTEIGSVMKNSLKRHFFRNYSCFYGIKIMMNIAIGLTKSSMTVWQRMLAAVHPKYTENWHG